MASAHTVPHIEPPELFKAAGEAKLEDIRRIVHRKCDINMKDSEGYTALMHVAVYANTDKALPAIKQLLRLKADPAIRSEAALDNDNDTAFEKACARSRADSVCSALRFVAINDLG